MKRLSDSANRKKARTLKSLRQAKGLKGSWVAGKIGIGAGYLCNLENGKKHWTDEMEANFLQAIGEQR